MDRVEALLYLLMRDVVPAGKLRTVIGELATAEVENFEPSSPELGELAKRYARLLRGEPEAPEDDEVPRVEPIKLEMPRKQDGPVVVLALDDAHEVSQQMLDWLAGFDRRVHVLLGFADAVNEAAAAGRALDEETRQLVFQRAKEITEQMEARRDG